MPPFDCLSRETNILGPHFLEASAGTGKTFAVEHIVARLLLSGIELEQILVVTFTRAATRELRLRIRSNLQRILDGAEWDYLQDASLTRLADALAAFDRCQIFTIHGFCHRMLKERSFELGIAPLQPEGRRGVLHRREAALRDFLEFQLTADLINVKQLYILLASVGGVEQLASKLKKADGLGSPKPWVDRVREFEAARVRGPRVEYARLSEDFAALRVGYKKVKGDLEGQVRALSDAENPLVFEQLVEERGSLFEFLDPQNKKVKAKDPQHLHYPGFFDWARSVLFPLIQSAADPSETFATIAALFKPIDRKVLEEEGALGPDELLLTMQRALDNESFRTQLQKKYRAVLIDEFQDTDPVQWDIFQRLFLSHTEAMYLIGDPKQSIYRFRKADLYTYLKAKDAIPAEGHFHLDTNFRSSRALIDVLNGLFHRDFLYLPKEKRSLPYLPVKAGRDVSATFSDAKGAVHCVLFEREETYRYIAREIQQLKTDVAVLSEFAVLVKDRYEAIEMQGVLNAAGIPSTLKSQNPLSQTLAFKAIVELFDALTNPKDIGKTKVVLAGPFGGYSADQLRSLENFELSSLRRILDDKGLARMFQAFVQLRVGGSLVQERMVAQGGQFYSDVHQVLEVLFEWEASVGFSWDALTSFMEHLEQSTDDAIIQRTEEGVHGVHIMTMHASKGLEFDVVFALGLASRTSACDEEANAEKQRLLYVAMTRAKRRLYVPIPVESKQAAPGTASPIELFCASLGSNGAWQQELERLAGATQLTIERVDSAIVVSPDCVKKDSPIPLLKIPPYQPSYLLSFTSLTRDLQSQPLEPLPEGHFPRGAEIGVVVHRVFERIFLEGGPVAASVPKIVEEELLHGPFDTWKEKIVEAVQASLDLPLPMGFCLRDIDPALTRVETEFLFASGPHYLKGLIDLLFMHNEKLYFVDWKTNWLGNYTPECLQKALALHQYDLQASIYAEALHRSNVQCAFGGAIYLFVRGPSAICFEPERERLALCLNK